MERDLCGGDDLEPPVCVAAREGAERLHHALLVRLRLVDLVDDHVAGGQLRLHVTVGVLARRAEVSAVVRAAVGHERVPVLLRVDEHRVVQRLLRVEHGGQHLIAHADEPHRRQRLLLRLRRDDGDRIAHAAQVPVEDQPIIRAELRVGLPGEREARLRHIPVRQHAGDARHALCAAHVDLLDHRIGVRAAQQLDDEAVLRRDVRHIDGLAGGQRHGVLLADAHADSLHARTPFSESRYRRMPRLCPM